MHIGGQEGRRQEVLRLLRDAADPMGVSELADRLGVHNNTVRFHLETLVNSGQVERTTSGARTAGRPPQLFQAVRGMDPLGPRHYQLLAEVLIHSEAAKPDASRRGLEAGRTWGREHLSGATTTDIPVGADESEDRLMLVLDELGFAPARAVGGDRRQIGLRNCPFLELSSSRSEIVCSIHLGLMQGALESWRAPVTVDKLDPFVEADLCVAHLSPAGAS